MSSLTHTKVDTDQISTTISNIESSISVAESAFATLDDLLLSTLQPTWSGDASTKFYQLYHEDTVIFKSFIKLLRDVNQRLLEASSIYDSAEAEAVDIANSIRVAS